MFSYKLKTYVIVVLVAMGMQSCMKDVDFTQAGDISLQPRIQSDLLIFDVNQEDFLDVKTGELKTVIRDTVRLEFLDDSYIQKDLATVEFKFRYHNTFPQSFYNKISFLSESDRPQHKVEFFIGAGGKEDPAVTEKIELIDRDQIGVIKRSIKMVVEIQAIPGEESFEGNLDFASKGLFSFEF